MVEAANRATLQGHPLAWEAVYCFTIDGDHIAAGRRYYDQSALFAVLLGRDGPHALAGDGGEPSAGGGAHGAAPVLDPPARAAAWSCGDAAVLAQGLRGALLQAPGGAGATPGAYIVRALRLLAGFEASAATVVQAGGAVAFEWRGSVPVGGERVPFGVAEVVDRAGGRPRWRLAFDTTTVDPDPQVAALRAALLAPPG